MSLTRQLIKTEINKLGQELCKKLKIEKDDGKKFSLLMLKKLSGYKELQLEEFYCEGGREYQIDGVYFQDLDDEFQINIITCEFKQGVGTFGDKDITDLINNGLPYLLLNEKRGLDVNEKLKNIREEINERKANYKERYAVVIKFITTSEEVLSPHGKNEFSKFQVDWQSKGINIIHEEINGEKLSALFSKRSVLNTEMPIKLSGRSFYSLSGKDGFVCRLPVRQVINMYCGFEDNGIKYPGYGDFLFEDNVRKNLGLEKRINQSIYDTATDEAVAVDFEYFNNGLTIIYDEKPAGNFGQDSPIIYLKGLQVVNGCQTVATLVKAYEDKKLKKINDMYINCRFIKRIIDKGFISSVITYTNSQNAISERDLRSNDRIQYEIQGILRNNDILYERKLNEFQNEVDEKRLDALDAAQSYLCCELQEPYRAKQQKKDLFGGLYKTIFDASKHGLAYQLYFTNRILEYATRKKLELQSKKRKIKKTGKKPYFSLSDLVITNGSYHIAALLYKKYYLGQDLTNIVRTYSYPENIDDDYRDIVLILVKDIKSKDIKRETLAQHFKSLESYEY